MPFLNEVPQPLLKKKEEPGAWTSFGNLLSASGAGAERAIARTGAYYAKRAGFDKVGELLDTTTELSGMKEKQFRKGVSTAMTEASSGLEGFSKAPALGILGNVATMLPEASATGAAGVVGLLGGPATSLGAMGAVGTGFSASRMVSQALDSVAAASNSDLINSVPSYAKDVAGGMSHEKARRRLENKVVNERDIALASAVYGSLNAIPGLGIESQAIRAFARTPAKAAVSALTRIPKGAIGEMAQEIPQESVEDIIGQRQEITLGKRAEYDPAQTAKRGAEAGIMAGFLGGALGAPLGIVEAAGAYKGKPKPAAVIPPDQAAAVAASTNQNTPATSQKPGVDAIATTAVTEGTTKGEALKQKFNKAAQKAGRAPPPPPAGPVPPPPAAPVPPAEAAPVAPAEAAPIVPPAPVAPAEAAPAPLEPVPPAPVPPPKQTPEEFAAAGEVIPLVPEPVEEAPLPGEVIPPTTVVEPPAKPKRNYKGRRKFSDLEKFIRKQGGLLDKRGELVDMPHLVNKKDGITDDEMRARLVAAGFAVDEGERGGVATTDENLVYHLLDKEKDRGADAGGTNDELASLPKEQRDFIETHAPYGHEIWETATEVGINPTTSDPEIIRYTKELMSDGLKADEAFDRANEAFGEDEIPPAREVKKPKKPAAKKAEPAKPAPKPEPEVVKAEPVPDEEKKAPPPEPEKPKPKILRAVKEKGPLDIEEEKRVAKVAADAEAARVAAETTAKRQREKFELDPEVPWDNLRRNLETLIKHNAEADPTNERMGQIALALDQFDKAPNRAVKERLRNAVRQLARKETEAQQKSKVAAKQAEEEAKAKARRDRPVAEKVAEIADQHNIIPVQAFEKAPVKSRLLNIIGQLGAINRALDQEGVPRGSSAYADRVRALVEQVRRDRNVTVEDVRQLNKLQDEALQSLAVTPEPITSAEVLGEPVPGMVDAAVAPEVEGGDVVNVKQERADQGPVLGVGAEKMEDVKDKKGGWKRSKVVPEGRVLTQEEKDAIAADMKKRGVFADGWDRVEADDDYFRDEVPDLNKIQDDLQRFAQQILGHPIKLHVVESIEDYPSARGMHLAGDITIAILPIMRSQNAASATGIVGHELIHYMRHRGIFTKSEWAVLDRYGRREAGRMPELVRHYAELYVDRPDAVDTVVEEVIARRFQQFVDGVLPKGTPPGITRVFQKLKDFLDRLANYLEGAGFRTAPEIFEAVTKGEMAGRKSRSAVSEPMFATAPPTEGPPQQGGRWWHNPITNTRKAWIKGRAFAQLAQDADKLFGGAANNPLRRVVDWIERRRVVTAKYIKEGNDLTRRMLNASHQHGEKYKDFVSLLFDATVAKLHPDVPLTDPKNAHLQGKDAIAPIQPRSRHAKLHARWNALPEDLQTLWRDIDAYTRERQDRMSLDLLQNLVTEVLGSPDNALAERMFNGTATDADWDLFKTNEALSAINSFRELKKLDGFYMPLIREGDYVVRATHDLSKHDLMGGTAIDDNTVQFVDPTPGKRGGKTKVRAMAKAFIGNTDLTHRSTRAVFVDPNDHTKIVPAEQPGGLRAYRVRLQTEHVEFTDTAKKAESARAALEAHGGYKNVKGVQSRRDEGFAKADMLASDFNRMADKITTIRGKPLDGELAQALREAALRSLGSTRAQARRLPRTYVAGYSEDAPHILSTYNVSSAGYLGKLETQPEVDKALKEANDYSKEHETEASAQTLPRSEYLKETTKRVRDLNERGSGLWDRTVDTILGLSQMDKLWTPSYHIINALQNITVTTPVLAGRHGIAATARAMAEAYSLIGAGATAYAGMRDTVRAGKSTGGNLARYLGIKGGKPGTASRPPVEVTDYGAQLRDRLSKAPDSANLLKLLGELDYLIGPDASFEVGLITGKTFAGMTAINHANFIARQIGQSVETINRSTAAIAAFRLEMAKNGGNVDAAIRYAKDTVNNTHFNYSQTNAPAIMSDRHPLARIALQFKKYAQGMVYLMVKLGHTAISSQNDPKVRLEAAKSLAYVMGTTAAIAGALGLPTEPFKIGVMALSGLGLIDDDWDDVEKWVEDNFGVIAAHGLPNVMGVDLSTRTGLNNMLLYGSPGGETRKDTESWMWRLVSGAAGSYAGDVLQATTQVPEAVGGYLTGNWDQGNTALTSILEKTVPMKQFSDTIAAYRMATEGKTNKRGDVITEPSPVRAGLKLFGFQSTREAQDRRAVSAMYRDTARRDALRQDFFNRWKQATSAQERQAIFAEVKVFNRSVPKAARIKWKSLNSAVRRQKKIERTGGKVKGVYLGDRNADLAQ